MQALYPVRLLELAEALAWHYERGEVWDRALAYYLLAVEKGKGKYTYASASGYARTALEIAKKMPGQHKGGMQALVFLGDLASLMGDLDAANGHYNQALALETEAAHHQHIANQVHHRHFAWCNGARIAFYTHGTGEETLFLASPSAYFVAIFQPVVEALCQEFRVVTYDPRGTGASDPVPEQYPIRQRVEDLRAVIEALESGPVIAVGLSQAGNHMVRLAWASPGLIKKLVLVGTPPGDREQLGVDYPRMPEKRIRQRQAIGRGDFSELEDYFIFQSYAIFSEPEARDLAEEFYQTVLQLPRDVLRNFAAGVFDPDFNIVPLLSEIHVPTLVINGTADRLVPFAAAPYIVERLPSAQLYAFEGKGHLPIYTATYEFCEVLRHFVGTGTVPETRGTNT
jgi:pimeloyl-ACP methyl ester carboxylesterase